MPNFLYDKARQGFLDAQINWSGDNTKVVLVDTGLYTPNMALDQFLSVVPLAARLATSGNMTGKTSVNGTADADDTDCGPLTQTAQLIVIYQDTGSDATSRLIAAIEVAGGLPVSPTGGTVIVVWDAGCIFEL